MPLDCAIYDTVAEMSSITVSADVEALRVNGYASAGDGGAALYKKVASQPSHQGRFQTLDGAWWELVPSPSGHINVLNFPGPGIGAKFNAAIAAIKAMRQNNLNTWLQDSIQLIIQPGTYTLDDTLVIDTCPNVHVSAYGATIKSALASPVLKVVATSRAVVSGLQMDLRNNNVASEALLVAGSSSWNTFVDCAIQANSSNTAFAAVRMKQGNVAGFDDNDRNKGNFWNTFDRIWVRKLMGADPNNVPVCFDLQGCNNATRIINSSFTAFGTGVLVRNQNGSLLSGASNDVQILLTAFEGFTGTACVWQADGGASLSAAGGTIAHCRFEAGGAVAQAVAMNVSPSCPITLLGNTVISSVPTYIVAGSDYSFNSLDSSWTPGIAPRIVSNGSMTVGTISGSGVPSLKVIAQQKAAGRALALSRFDGTVDGGLSQMPGGGMDIDGGAAGRVRMSHVTSLSASGTLGFNFRGTITNPASGSTVNVTFAAAEPDANYSVFVSGDQQRIYWTTAKTATGFTINTDTPFAGAGQTSWMMVR